MSVANHYHLDELIGVLNTLDDEEIAFANSMTPLDACRLLIRQFIKPTFEALTNESQKACKDSLRYFLTTGHAPFDAILSAQQEFPIDPPGDPKDFFIWIWEELFPNEDFKVEDVQGWSVENNLVNARLRRRMP
jgi:hypothetical protein